MGLFDIFKKKQTKEEVSNIAAKAVFTCRHVMDGESPILYMACDADGDLQFFCANCGESLDLNQVMVVAVSDVYKRYETDVSFAQGLQMGQFAVRDENGDWQINDIESNEYTEWFHKVKNAIEQENIRRNKALRSDYSGIKIYR